jgi:hypothetical protein
VLVRVVKEERDACLPLHIHPRYTPSTEILERRGRGRLTDSHATVTLGDEKWKVAA